MSDLTGIHAWGSYLPAWRMRREVIAAQTGWLDPAYRRARGRRTLANWDEDALTMAVAAGRSVKSVTDCRRLVFASTTAPFLDRSNCGLIRDALGLPDDTHCQDVGGSQRAATAALLDALSGRTDKTLIVAADRRVARPASALELRYGDGAAAVVVAPGEGVAQFLGGHSVQRDIVHQYRTLERITDYVYEDRWVRDTAVLGVLPAAIEAALDDCDLEAGAIDRLIVPVPQRHAKPVAAALGIDESRLADDLLSRLGEAGAGHPLLQLSLALESASPGEVICLCGVGQGGDAMLFRATDALRSARSGVPMTAALRSGRELDDYLRLPHYSRQLQPDRGLRDEADRRTAVTSHARRHADLNAMRGSRCEACGTPHYPSARMCVACRAVDRMAPRDFSHSTASVKTFTEDWQAATPVPPLVYGNVAFEGGGNAFMEITDTVPGQLAVGRRLAMQFRVKDFDEARGFRRYVWKGAPLRGDEDA